MSDKDNLDVVSNNILDGLKSDGIEPKLDDISLKRRLKNFWENPKDMDETGDYLEPAPTIEDLEKNVEEIAQTAAEAMTKAELAYSATRRLQLRVNKVLGEINEIYQKTLKLEQRITVSQEKLENIKSVVSLMNGLVVGGLVMMLIAFIGWILQDIQFRHSFIDEWNQKIIQNENIVSDFSDMILEEEWIDKEYVDSKIESEINKVMIDFYKSK